VNRHAQIGFLEPMPKLSGGCSMTLSLVVAAFVCCAAGLQPPGQDAKNDQVKRVYEELKRTKQDMHVEIIITFPDESAKDKQQFADTLQRIKQQLAAWKKEKKLESYSVFRNDTILRFKADTPNAIEAVKWLEGAVKIPWNVGIGQKYRIN
jgi:hypothetical protein